MTCPVCGYHSGLRSPSQLLCPRVHLFVAPPAPYDPDPVEASAYGNDGPDVPPKERCGFCVGGVVDGTDCCPRCWGSREAD